MGRKKKIVQNVVLGATFSREDTGRIIEEPSEYAKKIKIRTQNSGDTDILISQIKDIEGNKVNIFNIKPDNYIYICKNEHNTIIKAILMKDVSTKPILKNQEESKKPQKELPKALKTAEIVSTKPKPQPKGKAKEKAKPPNRVVEQSPYQPKERHQAKQETVESRSQAKLKYVGQVCDLLEKGVQVVYSKGDELPHKFNICYSFFTQQPNIGDIVEFTIQNKEVVEVYIPRQDYIQPNSPRKYSPDTSESDYKLLEDINHGNPNIYRQNISSASELHARKSQLLQSDSERSTDYKYETSSTVPKVNNPSYENAQSLYTIQSQSSLNSSNLIRNIPKTDQSQGYSANSSISSNSESTQSNQTIFSNPPSTSIQLSGSYSSNPLSIPQTQASNPMPLIYSQQTYPYQNIPQQPLPISIPQAKAQNPIPYIYSQQPLSIPQAKAPNPIPYIYSQQSYPSQSPPISQPLNSTNSYVYSQQSYSSQSIPQQPLSIPKSQASNPTPLIYSQQSYPSQNIQQPPPISQSQVSNPTPLIYSQQIYPQQPLPISQSQALNHRPQSYNQEPPSISQSQALNHTSLICNQETHNYESCQPSQPINSTNSYIYDPPLHANSQIQSSNPKSHALHPTCNYQSHSHSQPTSQSSLDPSNIYNYQPLSHSQPDPQISIPSSPLVIQSFNQLISKVSLAPPQSVFQPQPQSQSQFIPNSLDQDSPEKISLFTQLVEEKLNTVSPCRIPARTIKLVYIHNTSFSERVNKVCQNYQSWRRVRGDGNCYYRAVGVVYLEHLCCSTTDPYEMKHFIDRIDNLTSNSDSDISQSQDISNLREWLVYLLSIKNQCGSAVEILQEYLKNSSFDYGMVQVLRSFTYRFLDHMKHNPEFSSFLIDGGEETLQRISKMGTEAEGEEFQVLADALGARIHHVSVYSSYGIDSFTPLFTSHICTEINILYKSGHYDILYTPATNTRDNYDVEGMNFRSNHYS